MGKQENENLNKELVENFVFPSDLSGKEEAIAAKELWEYRKKLLLNRSEEDKIYSNLLRLKYEMEDHFSFLTNTPKT